jgi:glycosyltransferase involved in cell wall biosynthesis
MRPLAVSVVIPTYNRAAIVPRAVESALAAMRPGDELLVVDDGSTDDTEARLRPFAGRIRHVKSAHVGVAEIRNRGVREARHPLVALLDSDDLWMPDKLELQRTVMERFPDVVLCFTDFGHRTVTGEEVRRYAIRWHHDPRSWDEILAPGIPYSSLGRLPPGRADFRVHVGDLQYAEMHGDYVCTSTAVVRRDKAGDALRFCPDLRRLDDWECFGRLTGLGPAAYLDCETQWNCDHTGPRVTSADDDVYRETERVIILNRVWGSDAAFLARHGERFRQVLAAHQQAKVRGLLVRGRTREARAELRMAGGAVTLSERALASLPGACTRAILAVRRRLRGGVPAAGPLTTGPAGPA